MLEKCQKSWYASRTNRGFSRWPSPHNARIRANEVSTSLIAGIKKIHKTIFEKNWFQNYEFSKIIIIEKSEILKIEFCIFDHPISMRSNLALSSSLQFQQVWSKCAVGFELCPCRYLTIFVIQYVDDYRKRQSMKNRPFTFRFTYLPQEALG